jgi:hypothetical protein
MRALLPFVLLVTGCIKYIGAKAQDYPPAQTPNGALATVTTKQGASIAGELLEVRDSAWVIATRQRIVLVPFRLMQGGVVEHSEQTIQLGLPPVAAVLQEHRLLSRFPYGMPDPALRELLASKRQNAMELASQ